jgi:hypothetical protein
MSKAALRPIAQGLFDAVAEIGFYGARLQTRMVVARLEGGPLWVYSPLRLDDALVVELDRLGEVRFVLSPNNIHNQGMASFQERYSNAEFWASPGLGERRPDLRFEGELQNAPEPGWQGEIDQRLTAGNCLFEEVICLHRASKTLIVADLAEQIASTSLPGGLARGAARLARIWDRPLPSPEFRAYTDHRAVRVPQARLRHNDRVAPMTREHRVSRR